jgi:hypothetical protein
MKFVIWPDKVYLSFCVDFISIRFGGKDFSELGIPEDFLPRTANTLPPITAALAVCGKKRDCSAELLAPGLALG